MEETIKIIRRKLAEINEANESQDIKENYIETRDNVTDIALLLCKIERALADSSHEETAALPLQNVINWMALDDKRPNTEWGDVLVCLENDTIFIANYSRIANERWLIAGLGNITDENPVKYWAELPKPPCL